MYSASGYVWQLSQARAGIAAASVGNKLLFGGGFSSGGPSIVVDMFDLQTNTWTAATLSQGRFAMAVASAGSKVLFAGGIGSDFLGTDAVDIFDSQTKTWTTAKLSTKRFGLAGGSIGKTALFGGGSFSSDGQSNTLVAAAVVDIYNSQNNSWTSRTLSKPRRMLSAIGLGNKAFFVGGQGASGVEVGSSIVDIYDDLTGLFTTKVP